MPEDADRPRIIRFPTITYCWGNLSFAQRAEDSLPFEPKRVYWIGPVPSGAQRGGHAHRETWEVVIALRGQVSVGLQTRQGERLSFTLEDPQAGLLIPPGWWRDLCNYEEGTFCLVLASLPYAESDYIRERGAFFEDE